MKELQTFDERRGTPGTPRDPATHSHTSGDAQMALERMRGERMMDNFEDVALPLG